MWSLPVYLDHITVLNSGLLIRVIVDPGVVVPCVERLLLMQNVALSSTLSSTALPVRQHGHSHHLGQTALRSVTPVQSVIPPQQLFSHLINCAEFCLLLLDCLVDMSIVDPKPFFQKCVNILCISNGNNDLWYFEGLHTCLARCRDRTQIPVSINFV